jgi:hypothetical protein
MRAAKTTGNVGLDRELDRLDKAITVNAQAIAALPVGSGKGSSVASVSVPSGASAAASTLTVEQTDGTNAVPDTSTLQADLTGSDLAISGTTPVATLARQAQTAVTPLVDGVAAQGTSTHAANADHVHPAATLVIPVVTSDPELLQQGRCGSGLIRPCSHSTQAPPRCASS